MIRSATTSSDSSYSHSLRSSSTNSLSELEELNFNDSQQEIQPSVVGVKWTKQEKEIISLAKNKIQAIEKHIQEHLSPLIRSPDFERCHPHLFTELKRWISSQELPPISPHLTEIEKVMQSLREKNSIDNQMAEKLNQICLMDLNEILTFSDYLLIHQFLTAYRDFLVSEKSMSIGRDIFNLLAKDIVSEDNNMKTSYPELEVFLNDQLQRLNYYYLSSYRDEILIYRSLLSTAAQIAVIATTTFVKTPSIAASQNIMANNNNPTESELVATVRNQLKSYVVIQRLQGQSLPENFDLTAQSIAAKEFAAIEEYYNFNALNIPGQFSKDWELPFSIQLDALVTASQHNRGAYFKNRTLCLVN
jgi:hypothetical protein